MEPQLGLVFGDAVARIAAIVGGEFEADIISVVPEPMNGSRISFAVVEPMTRSMRGTGNGAG
jgi:hypothetical protein